MLYNYYWDETDPAKPFKNKVMCNAFTIVPDIATRIAPPRYKYGTIPCWNGKEWVVRADWRQETLYDIHTGKKAKYPTVDIDEAYFKANFTTMKPSSIYDKWNGSRWVLDEEARLAGKIAQLRKKRQSALDVANHEIGMIEDALDCLRETHGDTGTYESALRDWRKYRGRIIIMKFTTGDEVIPVAPESIAL